MTKMWVNDWFFFFLAITIDVFKHPCLRVLVFFFFLLVHVLFIYLFLIFITISTWGVFLFLNNSNKVF